MCIVGLLKRPGDRHRAADRAILPRVRKFFIGLFMIVIVSAGAAWLGGSWLLERATRTQMSRVEGLASGGRVVFENLNFEAASLSAWPVGARWSGWTATARILASGTKPADTVPVSAGSLVVTIGSWAALTADVRAEGIELGAGLDPELPGGELPFDTVDSGIEIEGVSGGFAGIPGISLLAVTEEAVHELAGGLRELMTTGSTVRALDLGARIHLRLRGVAISGRLFTKRADGRTTLRLDRSDVEAMAAGYERALTEAEKSVLAEYPLRAVSLLRIKEYAGRLSAALARNDGVYDEDVSRHVIWSYWLSRVFGDAFATRVTDAHEQGATGNTAAERAKDLANNAVGRRYAMTGLSESQMLRSIRTDPSIVRPPPRG